MSQTVSDLASGGAVQSTDLLVLYRPSELLSYSYFGSQITDKISNPLNSLGDTFVGGTSGTPTALSGNTTTTPQYLKSVGTGSVANAQSWSQVLLTDIYGVGTAAEYNVGTTNGTIPVLTSTGLPVVSSGLTTVTDPTTSTIQGLNTTLSNLQTEILAIPSSTTNVLSSSVNTMSSDVNSISSTAPIINTNAISSSANTLSLTINGVANTGTGTLINTNATSYNGNNLVSTVNGIASALTEIDGGTILGYDATSSTVTNTVPFNTSNTNMYNYINSLVQGLSTKDSCQLATTANITLAVEQTIDGVLTSSSRVLVKNQSTSSQNGIYITGTVWTRTTDFALGTNQTGAFTFIEQGTANANTGWTFTSNANVGTSSSTVTQFSGAGSYTATSPIVLTGTVLSINNATSSTFGTIKPDNTNITISAGVINTGQNISSGSAPVFAGTNFTGTATSLTAGNATLAATATNIAAGTTGQLHVQTGAGATGFISTGSATTQALFSGGTGVAGAYRAIAATDLPAATLSTIGAVISGDGTFTPILTANTPGDLNIVYSNQLGYYTKVGNLIFLNIIINTTTFTYTTASGNLLINGLPITSASTAYAITGSMIFSGITKAGYTQFGPQLGSSSTQLQIVACSSGASASNVAVTNIPSGTNVALYINMVYNI